MLLTGRIEEKIKKVGGIYMEERTRANGKKNQQGKEMEGKWAIGTLAHRMKCNSVQGSIIL